MADLRRPGPWLTVGGLQLLLLVHIAEFVYPGYSVSQNYISDLGVGPWPAWAIFSAAVMAMGLVALLVAALLYRTQHGHLWLLMALAGVGTVGVALFNEDMGELHFIFSLMAFGFGNLAVIYSIKVSRPPFRQFSLAMGLVGTSALVLFGAGAYLGLGPGGMERMIFYPIAFWTLGFGVYLMTLDMGSRGS